MESKAMNNIRFVDVSAEEIMAMVEKQKKENTSF